MVDAVQLMYVSANTTPAGRGGRQPPITVCRGVGVGYSCVRFAFATSARVVAAPVPARDGVVVAAARAGDRDGTLEPGGEPAPPIVRPQPAAQNETPPIATAIRRRLIPTA